MNNIIKTSSIIDFTNDINLHRWHILDVSQNHSVSIPNPPRILITVSPMKS